MNSRIATAFAWSVAVLSVLVVLKPIFFVNAETRLLRRACNALRNEKWVRAEELAEEVLKQSPDHPKALTIAGVALARQFRSEEALVYLEQVPETPTATGITALRERGIRHVMLGQVDRAESCFQKALTFAPDDLVSRKELALMLSFEGRCAEAGPHWMTLVQRGRFRADELYLLGIPDLIHLRDDDLWNACEKQHADIGLHDLSTALHGLRDHKLETVDDIISKLRLRYPEVGMVQGVQGKLLLQQDRLDDFLAWHSLLPQSVSDHPEVWHARAVWAMRTKQSPAAARCLLETLKREPNHVEATYRLTQVFHVLGEEELTERFSQRSESLSRLSVLINDLRGNPDLRMIRLATEELESLGRDWEALAWAKLAREHADRHSMDEPWIEELWQRLSRRTSRMPERIAPQRHPLVGIDLDSYPEPSWNPPDVSSDSPGQLPPVDEAELATVHFEESAQAVGLDFRYFNSMDPDVGLEHIFQTTGGGIAALDYDGDYRPDLYFGQGRPLPENVAGFNTPQSVYSDRLYRNQGNAFVDVSAQAGLGDDRFTQGVTHGDFNNDGFPDLFVCNVGHNRFYENNGDGTFTEITNETGTAGDEWSMSAMIADLDEDGRPDLYVVNYLKSDQVLTRSCRSDNGHPITCAPTLFDGERDRVYRNLGDGRFEELTSELGIVGEETKGLGIVGYRDRDTKRLNVFIANDSVLNQLYRNVAGEENRLTLKEEALLSGIAVSDAGVTQACMGVAAGDFNSDGTTDFYITNFIQDYNTLFLQQADGRFSDETRIAKLITPTVNMLGFGTQYLDANLDGHLDLIVTNGHVDQSFATGEPDLMAPQFFLNRGRTFTEAPPESLGPFFEEKNMGRGLAKLDWNRDGRADACIVYLNREVALLTNRSNTAHRGLTLHLRGDRSSRDAIGTVVRVRAGKRNLMRELTAGDGYQVSNERMLIFGLADAEKVDELIIEWPSGEAQSFGPLETNHEWLAVEGRAITSLNHDAPAQN